MKNLLIGAVCLFALSACQDENAMDPTTAAESKLGVVIKNSSDATGINGLILLKDGRTINPVSGFREFSSVQVGSKFKISFDVVNNNGEIFNVNVKGYTDANDSTFSFNPPPVTLDSIATTAFLQGTFKGGFTYCPGGNCHTDTTTVTISNGINYTSKANNYFAGGAGTIDVDALVQGKITFHNTAQLGNVDPNVVLNGVYQIHAFNNYLSLIRWTDNSYTSYLLKK